MKVSAMNMEDLDTMLASTEWFSNLGNTLIGEQFELIDNLLPWGGVETGNSRLELIADEMEWLPSSRDQPDPFYGNRLEEESEKAGLKSDFATRAFETYKLTLRSLRAFDGNDSLKAGPHDFTEAARGAALYASRRAAYEVLLNAPGAWCKIIDLYHHGRWPCGILRDGRLVVL